MPRNSHRSPRPEIVEGAFLAHPGVTPSKLLTFDQLFRAFGGHRYEILTILALHHHLKAGDVATRLNLKKSLTSRDLQILYKLGIVNLAKDGSIHWFGLSPRLRAFERAGRVQLGYGLPNGDWLWLHREEFSRSKRQVALPASFLDPTAHGPSRSTKSARPRRGS